MDKKFLIIGVLAGLLVLGAAAAYYVMVFVPDNASPAHVEDLHMKMSSSSLGELEAIIRGSAAPYTRERAVIVYADIAGRSDNTDRAMAFLKGVAQSEKDGDVRTAAYTNYYWLKDTAGIQPETRVDTRVLGDIRPGKNITVLFTVTSLRGSTLSTVGLQARNLQEAPSAADDPGTMSMTVVDANTGKGALTNVVLTPSHRIRRPLPANVSVEFPYTVTIKGPGKVVLEAVVEARYDLVDYDRVKKDIFLDVGTGSGSYVIA